MKTFLMVLLTIALTNLNDNYHESGKSEMVYYSPKNSVRLNFTYVEQREEAGEFAPFAEELLGIKDAITENKTTYTFKGVEITTHTQVDLKRPHFIHAEKGMPWLLANINDRGLLVGYNLPEGPKEHKNSPKKDTVRSGISPTHVLPYTEEIVEAGNVRGGTRTGSSKAQAQAVAKQIFRIRETRMYLLNGEVEHAPADGKAMELVLKELKRQEKQLLELFTGKKTSEIKHKHMGSCPYGENFKFWNETLYFSAENGFTGADNVDADKIKIQVEFVHQYVKKQDEGKKAKKDKNAPEPSPIMYNLPGSAIALVYYNDDLIQSKVVPMAQFGIDVPLPKELFTGNELPKIKFSEKTGNVISISK